MPKKVDFRQEALNCLRYATEAKGYRNVEGEITCFKDYLALAGLKPEDIGTSEKKLEEYLKEGYFSEARAWLEKLRSRAGYVNVKLEVHSVLKFIGLSGKTLADLYTSQEELESLLTMSKTAD